MNDLELITEETENIELKHPKLIESIDTIEESNGNDILEALQIIYLAIKEDSITLPESIWIKLLRLIKSDDKNIKNEAGKILRRLSRYPEDDIPEFAVSALCEIALNGISGPNLFEFQLAANLTERFLDFQLALLSIPFFNEIPNMFQPKSPLLPYVAQIIRVLTNHKPNPRVVLLSLQNMMKCLPECDSKSAYYITDAINSMIRVDYALLNFFMQFVPNLLEIPPIESDITQNITSICKYISNAGSSENEDYVLALLSANFIPWALLQCQSNKNTVQTCSGIISLVGDIIFLCPKATDTVNETALSSDFIDIIADDPDIPFQLRDAIIHFLVMMLSFSSHLTYNATVSLGGYRALYENIINVREEDDYFALVALKRFFSDTQTDENKRMSEELSLDISFREWLKEKMSSSIQEVSEYAQSINLMLFDPPEE